MFILFLLFIFKQVYFPCPKNVKSFCSFHVLFGHFYPLFSQFLQSQNKSTLETVYIWIRIGMALKRIAWCIYYKVTKN